MMSCQSFMPSPVRGSFWSQMSLAQPVVTPLANDSLRSKYFLNFLFKVNGKIYFFMQHNSYMWASY